MTSSQIEIFSAIVVAEDFSGHNFFGSNGWKPGAISKRLLRKLNNAKHRTSSIEQQKPLRRSKKSVEDKPTLIVAKRNGEYHVEMEVMTKDNEEQCKPLMYRIASANNQKKIERRQRRAQRLIDQKDREVWKGCHPEINEKTCLKAYKQAVGVLPYDPNNPECNCSEGEEEELESCSYYEHDSSDYDSLDLDWEIHFTPPIAFNS